MLFPHLVWIDQASGVVWPTLSQAFSAASINKNLYSWLRLLGILFVSHAGLIILVAVASNLTRVRNAPAAIVARPGVEPFARSFVYFFAIVPPIVVTSVAVVINQATPVALAPLIVLSGLAVVMAAGDRIRIHHQRIIAAVWAAVLLLPPAIAAFAIIVVPWTGIDLRINQPSVAMTQFLSDSFERRTGTPLKVVGGDTRLASLLALLAPSRPVIFVDDKPDRPVTRKDIDAKGAVVVWLATDTAGAPPPAIKATFPDLVAEVPRAFERPVQGALPLFRIGWGMIRAKAPGAAPPPATPAAGSVIAFAFAHFAAEHPVNENHVAEDDRQQEHRADQHEDLARRRGRGLPDRERGRHQIRIARNHEPEIAEQEKRDARDKRQDVAPLLDPSPQAIRDQARDRRHRPQEIEIRQREPALGDARDRRAASTG